MRCGFCNTEVEENEKYCSHCGNVITLNGANQNGGAIHANDSGEKGDVDTKRIFDPQTGLYTTNNIDMPMKWYKFLIYVSLILGAIGNCYYGVVIFSGSHYKVDGVNQSEWVYAFFTGLKAIDILYGSLIIALGVFGIVTRQKLKKFSKQGPKYIMLLYASSVVISVFYVISVIIVTDIQLSEILTTKLIANVITSIIMIFVNKVYFEKREHLFIN